jgi:hypothetical protein
MKISDHIDGLGFLLPITAMLLIMFKAIFTGGAEFVIQQPDTPPAQATTNR